MTVARDIVYDSAALIGEYAIDKNLSAVNAQLMLRRLQRLIDALATKHFFAFATVADTFTMSPGVRSYASSLLASGLRPTSIAAAFVTLSNIDYAVEIISVKQWDAIGNKLTTGIPGVMYPEMTMPNATFHYWPTPYAAFVATLNVRRPATGTLTLDTTIALPPGYEQCLVEQLAVRSGDIFGTRPSPELVAQARESLATVKRNNYVPNVMQTGLGHGRDIYNPTPYKDF